MYSTVLSFETATASILYMIIYNSSVLLFLLAFFKVSGANARAVQSLHDSRGDTTTRAMLALAIFSMAGIPPLMGFFAKLLILMTVIDSHFAPLFLFFFVLLFIGLYFYTQNIQFLYSTAGLSKTSDFFFPKTTAVATSRTLIVLALFLTWGV